MDFLSLVQVLGSPKLRRDVRRFRAAGEDRREQVRAVGADVLLGRLHGSRDLRVQLDELKGHSILVGTTGGGKSWAAVGLMQLLQGDCHGHVGLGLVDGKGDLFSRALEVLDWSEELPPLVLDFGASDPVPYSFLTPHGDQSVERLVDRRMDSLDDLLGRDSQLSLRMSRMLRNVLLLAAGTGLTLPHVELLLGDAGLCLRLVRDVQDERLRQYFELEFEREKNATAPALLSRLDFLLRNTNLRLSFGSSTACDLGAAMNSGRSILVNTGGPTVSRQISKVVQSLVVSDLRQAVFQRKEGGSHYFWFLDESQSLMVTRADTDNLVDILTLGRSFGASLVLMTQSIAAVAPDRRFLSQLETNTKWMLMFRSGPDDARLLLAGLDTDLRAVRERDSHGNPIYETNDDVVKEKLREVMTLPQGQAFAWLKESGRGAERIHLPRVKWQKGAARPPVECLDPEVVERELREKTASLRSLATVKTRPTTKPKANLSTVMARLEKAMTAGGEK